MAKHEAEHCDFCGDSFKNPRALRAHARWCEAVGEGSESEDTSQGRKAMVQPRGFNSAELVRGQVETEEQRLRLREIGALHNALDKKEKREGEDSHQEGNVARGKVEELREIERRELRVREESRRYRAAIGRVKQRVMTFGKEIAWSMVGMKLTPEIKAQISVDIERELAALPDGLGEIELLTIVEGVADRFYERGLKAKKETDAHKTAARREKLRISDEAETEQRSRLQLVRWGESYAREQLQNAVDYDGRRIPVLEQIEIMGKVKEAVMEELDGLESRSQVEDLTEGILDDLGFSLDADE